MIQIVLPEFEIPDDVKKFHLDISFVMENENGEELVYKQNLEGLEVGNA